MMYCDSIEVTLKLEMTFTAGVNKLKLASINDITNEQMMVVI